MATILENQLIFDQHLSIEQGKILDQEETYFRQRIKRSDAAAVLLFKTQSNTVILTRQFRYPVAFHTSENLLEILAGKVDPGETPIETALREAEEETGYRIPKNKIQFLCSCFASPGYSTERFYLYYAEVEETDHIHKGGGLAEENEHIEIVEMQQPLFMKMIHEGDIQDAKTIIAALKKWA